MRIPSRSWASWVAIKPLSMSSGIRMEMKPFGDEAERFANPDEGTGEYNTQFAMWGLDRQFKTMLADGLGVHVDLIQSYAVGAKAGKQLRNDGIKSLFKKYKVQF